MGEGIALAISNITKIWLEYLNTGDKRRMQKAVRLGDKIVERCRELSINDKTLQKLLKKWNKYNN